MGELLLQLVGLILRIALNIWFDSLNLTRASWDRPAYPVVPPRPRHQPITGLAASAASKTP